MSSDVIQETRSTCPYCGTGCGVIINSNDGLITGVRGDPDHPANYGRLCSKGSTLHLTTLATGRVLHPQLRRDKASERTNVPWDTALSTAAQRFAAAIREHGPDSVAFYISGQLLTEDYYVFNKLARGLIGTNNIDSNSRLCMSSAVAGYKATLGMDSVPCCYEDIELADLFFISGANTAFAHPILFRRIEAAKAARPELKIVVVDPRRTDTAAMADLHLQIEPGSDLYLYLAMLHVLLRDALLDHDFIAEHTEGLDALHEQITSTTPTVAAAICGVPAMEIEQAAHWFGKANAPLSLWCQGLNQSAHGTANSAALVHLHLATGKIGRPGMGPFSLTGQPNAMGGREVGAMANLLCAHRDLKSAADRAEVAGLWGVPSIPEQPGLMAVQLFEAVRRGEIKALWIACTNPAHSLPDQTLVREALAACPFVVVQEAFADTDTCAYADLLLPAATWGEKDGIVTNSERRVSRQRPLFAPPGEARADWWIMAEVARRAGAEVTQVEVPWGEVVEPARFATALASLAAQGKPARLVAVVHAETSTGACQPLEEIGRIAREQVSINIGQDDWKQGRDRVKGQGTRLYITTGPGIEAYAAAIQARGGVLDQPVSEGWGFKMFAISDPDNFKLTFMTPLKK
mgnify:CR=1 FL=1